MAYDFAGLNTISRGGTAGSTAARRSVHSYATPDAAATVEGAGYFNSATNYLNKGDIIMAHMVINGTPVFKQYIVTSASQAATVVIALQATTAG